MTIKLILVSSQSACT